ncbi:uncharacterized protein LOC134781725 [Penaeus indicus]|uniref:uncharacterized protein LOC134781725 n=1 Tax=Penaeus indicus TaxID=29960 RepID=UPI00300D6EAA
MAGPQPRGPKKGQAPKVFPWQVLRDLKKAEKLKLRQEKEEQAKRELEKKRLKRLKCREKIKNSEKRRESEKERKKMQRKKKREAQKSKEKKEAPKLTPSQINKRQRKKKGKNQTVLIDDQGEEEEFGIIKLQRIRHPRALVREVKMNQKLKTGNKEALRAIKSKPRIKVRKLRGDGQGAKGNHPYMVNRLHAKRADLSKLENVKRHVQFLGGGLKVAWTDRPGRSDSGIEWMAHRSIEEELALRKKKKKKEMRVPEQSTKLNFKNIDGDMAFQLLANMPTTSKISFGTSCILIYNYATETKTQKDALSSGILSGAIKYISFLNMGTAQEGSSGSVQTIGGVQLRANCGLHVVFRSPISTQIMKQLLTDCSSAEIISFGDSCQVDFKSVKEAEDNWKTLQKLVLKNEKNNISFEELSILCVEPDPEAANDTGASEELKLLENVNEDENQTSKKVNEKLMEIEKKRRKMEEDEDEYGQYEIQAKKKKESVT